MSLDGIRCLEHCWLRIPEMNLAMDPMISSAGEGNPGHVFFEKLHPMLNITEEGARKIENSGFRLAPPEFAAGSEKMLDEAERVTLEEAVPPALPLLPPLWGSSMAQPDRSRPADRAQARSCTFCRCRMKLLAQMPH